MTAPPTDLTLSKAHQKTLVKMSYTVDDLAARARVVNINRECDSDDILSLASLCDPWQLVGQHLRLSPAQISAIDSDNRSTDLKRLGVLQKWRETFVFKATYKVLVGALIDCGKMQQALEVCQYLARKEESLGLTPPPEGVQSLGNVSAVTVTPSSDSHNQPHSTSLPSLTQTAACANTIVGLSLVNPSHLQLIKWKDREGKTKRFYLMDMIGSKWRSIGQSLGLLPSQLDGISTEHRDNAIECCRAVLGKWLENPPPDYPVTWDGLMELLDDCQLTQVSVKLKSALSEAKLL